jgi:hypothetical protein
MAPQKTPIRRRFGLRAALVFISALCVMVAFIAEERFRYRTEWAPELRAIREIERNGGAIFYDKPVRFIAAEASYLQTLRGDKYLSRIAGIYFGESSDDTIVASVGDLSRLNVRFIYIRYARITGSTFTQLEALPQLRELHIVGAHLNTDGWNALSKLTSLQSLTVANSSLNESAIVKICKLQQLEELDLSGSEIADAGLTHIDRLTQLHRLSLYGSSIGNEGLAKLTLPRSLDVLDLGATNIGDKSLKFLQDKHNLREVILSNTRVSQVAVAALQASLPDTVIDSDASIPAPSRTPAADWRPIRRPTITPPP